MRIKFLSIILAAVLCSCGARRSQAHYSYDTQLIGSEPDGSYTLVSWGKARHAADAFIQAQKQAVLDVIFHGVAGNTVGHSLKPLVYDMNAHKRHEDYFNAFFADNGDWKKYCSLKEKRVFSSRFSRTDKQNLCQTTVCVLRSELRRRLINDGIINL